MFEGFRLLGSICGMSGLYLRASGLDGRFGNVGLLVQEGVGVEVEDLLGVWG